MASCAGNPPWPPGQVGPIPSPQALLEKQSQSPKSKPCHRRREPHTESEAPPPAAAQPSEPREVTPRLSKRNQGHALLFRAGNFASLCILGCHPSVVVADALVPDKAGSERLPRGLCNGNGVVEGGVPALFRSRRLTQRVHPRGRPMRPWINASIQRRVRVYYAKPSQDAKSAPSPVLP